MKTVVNDFSGWVDNDRPRRTARPIFSHDLRDAMAARIAGRMRHGDLQGVFHLVFPQFVMRINAVSFEHGLNGNKSDLIVTFKRLCQFFKRWEPQLLTPRSPVLEKIKVHDHATIVGQVDGCYFFPVSIDPGVQLQCRCCLSQDAVMRIRRCGLYSTYRMGDGKMVHFRQRNHPYTGENKDRNHDGYQLLFLIHFHWVHHTLKKSLFHNTITFYGLVQLSQILCENMEKEWPHAKTQRKKAKLGGADGGETELFFVISAPGLFIYYRPAVVLEFSQLAAPFSSVPRPQVV